jgi:hypothetical protein
MLCIDSTNVDEIEQRLDASLNGVHAHVQQRALEKPGMHLTSITNHL